MSLCVTEHGALASVDQYVCTVPSQAIVWQCSLSESSGSAAELIRLEAYQTAPACQAGAQLVLNGSMHAIAQ